MTESTRRKSILQESGLPGAEDSVASTPPKRDRPQSVRFRSRDEVHVVERYHDELLSEQDRGTNGRPSALSHSPLPGGSSPRMYRLGAALLFLVAVVPFLPSSNFFGHSSATPIQGVSGGVIPEEARQRTDIDLQKRADSPTDACIRWSQQSAIVNGTLYLYGGEASTQSSQKTNLWNNNFLKLDLTSSWQTGSPKLTGLPQPSGPPAVALGYLWNSYESLYLYGGEFQWKPEAYPTPFSLWEYNIPSSSWVEHSNPDTSAGKSAPDNGVPVQRAAEGAGANVPSLGRGFYFGGHLDSYTTQGWSYYTPRVYLQSLLEFTFPGYPNTEVSALSNGQDAGSDGVYRNVTQGGLQSDAGFTQRADGLLIYVPGFGDKGILLALAGGTAKTFTQMNEINVYDIATSSWYTQATSGSTPKIRVNPCAVIAAAPDGSSYNIYMFGGQNLVPAGNQTQFRDMWILTLPSFTWIEVDQSKQSVPYGRSGATCNVWDAQMVMVGGYVGNQLSCDSPGIYVFDLSSAQWVERFTASSASSNGPGSSNPLNQQPNQRPNGLEGSYGYQVPEVVVKVVGGNANGGATVTKPAVRATAGPLATGSPVTYTTTGAGGLVTTETATPNPNGSFSSDESGNGGPNIAAIVIGVVCGVLALVICYLLFCLYLYRRQLQLYKRHVEMSQRQARGEKPPAIPGLWASDTSGKTSTEQPPNRFGITAAGESASQAGASHNGSGGQTSSTAATGYQSVRKSSDQSDTEDLLSGHEPTFVGVMLNPRRSLRVINRD